MFDFTRGITHIFSKSSKVSANLEPFYVNS